jgi:serine/threonine-protein kinase
MLADPEDGALEPGVRLDSYELLGLVARGGMANVWLARQRMKHGLETVVAIKTILPEFSLDPAFQVMFLDEARIACRIDHSNVARLLDVGEARGHSYIVMEHVAGESLSRLRKTLARDSERIPLDVALRVTSDLCAALHAAHELVDGYGQLLHVVHRDVSPQNILLSDGGMVKLIDFGVAKARDRFAAETSAGFAKGKARYMAPEQSGGGSVDRRADVWGVGAVLYELVAGRTPMDGPNDAAVFRALMGDAPVDRLPDEVPEPVRTVVHRALERSPDARFPTALAMRDALEEASERLGLRGTSMALERLCAQKLGTRIAERKRTVDSWLRAANAREGEQGTPVSASIGTVAAVTVTVVGGEGAEERSVVSMTNEATALAPVPRRRWRSAVMGAAGMLVLAAAGWLMLGKTPAPTVVQPAASLPPAAAPVPSPPSASTAPATAPALATTSAPSAASTPSSTTAHAPRGRPHPTAAPSHDWGGIQ